jgi:para-aminobenzoate synthetase component 1
VIKDAASLPKDWQQALQRGQLVAAEIAIAADLVTPQALAEAALQDRQGAFFFLETQSAQEGARRFSLLAGEPLFSFLARGRRGVWHGGGLTRDLNEPPEAAFEILGRSMAGCGLLEDAPGLCPMLGWLSYEAGGRYERLPQSRPDPLGMPDWYLMFPGELAWLDLERQEWRFRLHLADRLFYLRIQESLGLPTRADGEFQALHAAVQVEAWESRLRARLERAKKIDAAPPQAAARSLNVSDNFSEAEFCAAVSKAQQYIAAGDVFQVNLSHRQSAPYKGQAWPLFRRLSQVNPSPYACYAELGAYQVVSASPERLFMQEGHRVETHPIAGTRPRSQGGGAAEAAELLLSEKDRAEHVMTVDIERNDLARVCAPGTVRVRDLMALETYSHLHHLVSRVEGLLRDNCNFSDLLRAGFPGGSITGAPKIRCMEIIAELERDRRGLYTGSLGYWDPIHRRADFNILIRSIFLGQGRAYWQVGAGIVADSDPKKEWEETLQKAVALKLALETAPL